MSLQLRESKTEKELILKERWPAEAAPNLDDDDELNPAYTMDGTTNIYRKAG